MMNLTILLSLCLLPLPILSTSPGGMSGGMSGGMPGGFFDADPEDQTVLAAAEFMLDGLLDGEPEYSFSDLLKDTVTGVEVTEAKTQVVAGMNYLLTVRIYDDEGCIGALQVLVFQGLDNIGTAMFNSAEYMDEFPCDGGVFTCPSTAEDCDTDSGMCCFRTGGPENSLKIALWPEEFLGLNQWLCRDDYAFGLREGDESGYATLEVIKKTEFDYTLCTTIWVATDDEGIVAEGQKVKMRKSGTLALVDLEGGRNLKGGRDLEGSDTWKVVTGQEYVRVKMADLGPDQKVVKILKSANQPTPLWYVTTDGVEFLNLI